MGTLVELSSVSKAALQSTDVKTDDVYSTVSICFRWLHKSAHVARTDAVKSPQTCGSITVKTNQLKPDESAKSDR